jgi:hypothetical protein
MKNKKHDTEHFHNLDKLLISTVTQGSNPMRYINGRISVFTQCLVDFLYSLIFSLSKTYFLYFPIFWVCAYMMKIVLEAHLHKNIILKIDTIMYQRLWKCRNVCYKIVLSVLLRYTDSDYPFGIIQTLLVHEISLILMSVQSGKWEVMYMCVVGIDFT